MARNLCEAFTRNALRRSNQIAIQWKKNGQWRDVSYGELQKSVMALALALSRHYKIKEGDKAAILLTNRPEWPLVFFASLYAGAIPVPVNSQGTSRETENILANSECKIAFTENETPPVSIRAISVDSDEFKHALNLFPDETCSSQAKRHDDACIMYTSGTTSNPKGVVLSHGNLLANMYSLYTLKLMEPGEGIIAVLPLYHNYAMVVTTLTPLVYGARVVYPGSIRSLEVKSAIRESNAVLFVAVPLAYEMFHKTIMNSLNSMPAAIRFLIKIITEILYATRKMTGLNLARFLFRKAHLALGRSMRVAMCGGARLKKNIEMDLFKFGFTVLNGYGLTETSPVLTVNPLKRPKIGSVGLPVANVKIKIRNKDEKGVGDILARGPNVMKGYYKNEELTRKVMDDGWFITGDKGYIDKDGYLFVNGRKDDSIALATGHSILPDEIEGVYQMGNHIKEICVFDIPSSKRSSNIPILWAVAVPDMEFFKLEGPDKVYLLIKDSFEKVSRTLALPERLMGLTLTLDALPRTLLGKIKRKEVKKLYLSGGIKETFAPAKRRLTKSDLKLIDNPESNKILSCLKTFTGLKEIAPNDSFELDLKIDMLGRAELAYELEKKLGVKIKEDEINNVFRVGELIALITR